MYARRMHSLLTLTAYLARSLTSTNGVSCSLCMRQLGHSHLNNAGMTKAPHEVQLTLGCLPVPGSHDAR